MIWENILRLYNVADLYYSLNLNYVLPSVGSRCEAARQAAMVLCVSNPLFAKHICEKAGVLAENLPVYLIPVGEEVSRIAEQVLGGSKVTILENADQQTQMGAFVLCCKEIVNQYPYLGFFSDLSNPNHYPATVPESAIHNDLQNAANDFGYISQILRCFEENPQLGVLGTPFPIHHHGFGTYGDAWGQWYPATRQLAQALKLNCNLAEDKQPIMNTGVFWCRTAALQPLWKHTWKASNFTCNPISLDSKANEVLKRILPYVAQSEGYYSGVVMHTNYAAVRVTGQEFMLRQIVGTTKSQLKIQSDCYNGYMRQLEAYGTEDSGERTMVDLSKLSLRDLVLILADKYFPKRVVKAFYSFYTFCKRIFGKP